MLVTLGLTPALQRVMVFDAYTADRVNRARETRACAAGKAVNAARAARRFAPGMTVFSAGVQGGSSGVFCRAGLAAADITDLAVEIGHDTRTCVTVLDRATGNVTELVEEAPFVAGNQLEAVLSSVGGVVGGRTLLLCAGTLAPGAPEDFYARAAACNPAADLLVDAKGPALLTALAAPTRGARIAKLNTEEAMSTTGTADVTSALAALHRAGATHVVVTDGARAVHASAAGGGGVMSFAPPRVEVLNTTGCGDCLAGVLAAAWLSGRNREGRDTFIDAVVRGVAASAASAETLLPAEFDPARAQQLAALVGDT